MFAENSNEMYDQCMEALKNMSYQIQMLKNSDEYTIGLRIKKIKNHGFWFAAKKMIKRFTFRQRGADKINALYEDDLPTATNDRAVCNYYNSERIAVYTCIIGKYDELLEPMVKPDNIDYFAITDFAIPKDSKWTRINPEDYEEVQKYNPILKNRYFKINPHKIFPNYKYSIYVDGNFKIYSDLTEHVNRMSTYGFSHFRHSKRTSVYQEAEVCRKLGKETNKNIDNYIKRLRDNHFPDHYGLLACDILVREHNCQTCVKIMEQWWYEFLHYVKRDQLSLPFVLFNNGISVDDVSTLGGDVHKDYSFEILKHVSKKML